MLCVDDNLIRRKQQERNILEDEVHATLKGGNPFFRGSQLHFLYAN